MTKESLYFRYARNELVRNKGTNAALFVVLVLSASLMATGGLVMERLVGSIDALFATAKPPHFLQMHQGAYDEGALDRFAADHPGIEDWLIEEMVGFDGASLSWQRPTTTAAGDFADSLVDNLFVTQNGSFDLLVDANGAAPEPADGEVFLPVAHQQSYGLQPGDRLVVRTDAGPHTLTVAGFVRDAQMASSMSSATRILVSDADLAALRNAGGGAEEIIVEYRLDDPTAATDLQRAYEADPTLPMNGQAVTGDMIRMINAFSDGLVAVALMFASLLLIAIALLNVRFVIAGSLADEVREIGVMKAIGLPDKEISRLYLARYSALSLLACLVGGGLAVGAATLLSRGARANYAVAPAGVWTVAVPVLALVLVHVIVIALCRGVLRRIRRIEVVGALVHGSTDDERRTARRTRRRNKRVGRTSLARPRGSVGRRLALIDLRTDGRHWVLLPIIFLLATTLIALPANLLSTFESPRFVTYLGAPESDLRIDLQFSEDVDALRTEVLTALQADEQLTDVRAFAGVRYEVRTDAGWESLRVEVGDYSDGTVEFLHGERPAPGQIALSVLNADRYGLSVGDEVSLRRDGATTTAPVSGIYQDVTSGGHTAKLQGAVTAGAESHVIYANTSDGVDPTAVAADYSERFPEANALPMREYVQQTLSYVTDALRGAAVLALVFGAGIAVLITGLFLSLRLSNERRALGTLAVIGFSRREILAQLWGKTLLLVVFGTGLGVLTAATLGESLVGGLISVAGLGIAELRFLPDPLLVYGLHPLIMIGAGLLGTALATVRLRGADLCSWLER